MKTIKRITLTRSETTLINNCLRLLLAPKSIFGSSVSKVSLNCSRVSSLRARDMALTIVSDFHYAPFSEFYSKTKRGLFQNSNNTKITKWKSSTTIEVLSRKKNL
uniref:Uncharacterized protein n=1 Tax=Cacopsylla melanoneura TaxID=428564 RepID=A0A8D9F042_9HEMI